MNSEIFSGEVLRLAFGGQGILHQDSLVVFIPFTAPGDLITYRIIERKKNFAIGKLEEIIRPSHARTLPLCPYFGSCGGCQIQHLNYKAQLEYKRQSLQDALERQALIKDVIVPAVIPATQQWAYRRRISLTLRPNKGHFAAGYLSIDNRSLVEVRQCPIFTGQDDPVIVHLQEVAKKLICKDENEGKVTVLKQNDSAFLLHFHFKNMPSNATEIFNEAHYYPEWKGILATSPNKTLQFGQLETTISIDGLSFTFSPRAFIQNHPEQSLNIYHSICEHAKALCQKSILDLYCGIGISSLMLTRQGFSVTGVESNKETVKLAKENARRNYILSANFVQAEVQNVISSMLKHSQTDLIIVNPPREGLDPKVVRGLIENGPAAMLYISCMPPTLARDVKLLNERYHISDIEAYDMFPQTSHLETLAVLKRKIC